MAPGALAGRDPTATVAKAWYLASEARQLLGVAQQSVQVYGEQCFLNEVLGVRCALLGKLAPEKGAEERA